MQEQLLNRLTTCLTLPRPNVVAATARTGAITIVAREQEPEHPKYKGIPVKRKTKLLW